MLCFRKSFIFHALKIRQTRYYEMDVSTQNILQFQIPDMKENIQTSAHSSLGVILSFLTSC